MVQGSAPWASPRCLPAGGWKASQRLGRPQRAALALPAQHSPLLRIRNAENYFSRSGISEIILAENYKFIYFHNDAEVEPDGSKRIETKSLTAHPDQPSPPDKGGKKSSPSTPERPPEKAATEKPAEKRGLFGKKAPPRPPPEGFKVAVKASHPSPRPFLASDLTFD